MHPERIGPYQIDREIGAGGMGTVYYGRHVDTGKVVAVKVLPASLAREEGFVARFAREISALTKLTNPHVVELYESGGDADEVYYYAMEYVDGETLTSRLKRDKRIGWQEAIDISIQVCTALKAAHDAGIIHRDLKPSNLMLTKDGRVKLTDFGVAQVFSGTRLTASGGIIGTVEYMSPEQAQGRRATKKSDLYSLGAVMYVMLAGRPPFRGGASVEVLHKQRYGQFERLSLLVPEIPIWLEEIVNQLLEKDPDKRFADAYVLSLRLKSVIKKVELSEQDDTRATSGYDGSAATVAVNDSIIDESETAADSNSAGGPGPGTMMRDLVKAEIDREHKPGRISGIFDNVWVLVSLLVLIIGGGYYFFRTPELTAEEKFEAAVEILAQPENSEWLTARDKFLLPLVEQDSENWKWQVEPYLQKIKLYELHLALRSRNRRNTLHGSTNDIDDAERFYLLARHYQEIGDVSQAEQKLKALCALVAGDPEYEDLHALATQMLEEVRRRQHPDEEHPTLLQRSIQRANLLATDGKMQEARVLWKGIVELYGTDSTAKDIVERARTQLRNSE